jgi:hypothetical protein
MTFDFIDYVLDFYGSGGIYDMGATREQVKEATQKHIETANFPFDGDTIDREAVRDILIKEYGLIFPKSNGTKKNTHIQVS